MKLKQLINFLNEYAPASLQESYDNSGLIVGDPEMDIQGVLISLDCIEKVVEEAIDKKCNVIVSHHPILFKGLKSLTGKTYVERTIIKAVKNDIALFAIHTNLDNVHTGVNREISERLGLENISVLAPKTGLLGKLSFFAPLEEEERLKATVFDAGAGNIGKYSECSFTLRGKGSFLPSQDANPYLGEKGTRHNEEEVRIEVLYPLQLEGKILAALKHAHPYEEVAYYCTTLNNEHQEVGAGMIGALKQEMTADHFLDHVKKTMHAGIVRHTKKNTKPIKRVAVCGGSGSFLLRNAINAGADAFVTADFKYHEFFDAENRLMIADIGHFESEQFTIDLLGRIIKEKFSTFAVHLTEENTNPINYY